MKSIENKIKQEFRKVPVHYQRTECADVLGVRKLSSRVCYEPMRYGVSYFLSLRLGIECLPACGDTATSVSRVASQSNLESNYNPGDLYYRVNTTLKRDTKEMAKKAKEEGYDYALPLIHGDSEFLEIKLEFLLGPKRKAEDKEYWAEDLLINTPRYLSFYAGMTQGRELWKLYKLDLKDPENPVFEFVKTYSYVQGAALDSEIPDIFDA